MKLWLDDIRPAPSGWIHVKTAQEAIDLLLTGKIDECSLDHDLGGCQPSGYEVLCFLEEQAIISNWSIVPSIIRIHTANPAGRIKMESARSVIEDHRQFSGRV